MSGDPTKSMSWQLHKVVLPDYPEANLRKSVTGRYVSPCGHLILCKPYLKGRGGCLQAQRRFRERQKEKMKEARQEYERLQAAKKSLAEENARLTKETLVKTKVFMVRNALVDLYESAYSSIREREGSTPMLEECHASESDQGGSCMLKSLQDSGHGNVSGTYDAYLEKIPMPQFIQICQEEVDLLKSMKDYEDIYAEFHKRCLDLKSKHENACEAGEKNDAEEAAATRSLDSLFWHACRFRPELAIHLLCAHCCSDDQVLMQLAVRRLKTKKKLLCD